jgi:hypothetical protein
MDDSSSSVVVKGRPPMKKSPFTFFLLYAVVIAAIAMTSTNCFGPATSDGRLGVNISDQPVWGPTGYDRADYYYIPDIDSYYSVSEHQYIYKDGQDWRHAQSLPSRYSNYDPYHSYKVVISEDKPYQNNDSHRSKYGTFRGVKDQPVIRDSRDPKYFVNKDHPEHDNWVKGQTH